MIRVAICDDEPKELEKADGLLKKYAYEHPQSEMKADFFSAPLELLTYISENGGFDVLLLDVYLPGILGTDAAQELILASGFMKK